MGHDWNSYQATNTIYVGFGEQIKVKDNRQDRSINRGLKHLEKDTTNLLENPPKENILREHLRTFENFESFYLKRELEFLDL
jgi:hypothetical protein